MEPRHLIVHPRISAGWLIALPALLLGASLERGSGAAAPPCPTGAAAKIHYGARRRPRDDRRSPCSARRRSKSTWLTDRAVIDELREAAERGVKVRIWPDASEAARLSDFDVEARLGGQVQGLEIHSKSPGGELMHLKGYCVDHRLLRTGSANFSRSGETRQDNDLVVLRGASVCTGFDAKFDRACESS
jgi:PLD-like domain